MSGISKLTQKQQRFVDEYLISGNATQAAIKAGYSKKTARKIGQENLTKPDIKAKIDKRNAEIESEKIMTMKEVMQRLTAVPSYTCLIMLNIPANKWPRKSRQVNACRLLKNIKIHEFYP